MSREGSFKVLRDIDHEVSHLFKFVYYIHIVNTCLIVLSVGLYILNLCLTEIIAQIVDAVFCITCIGYLLKFALVCSIEIYSYLTSFARSSSNLSGSVSAIAARVYPSPFLEI